MKFTVFLIAICFSLISGCKSKEKIILSTGSKEIPSSSKTTGKVSHQFNSTGCSTVIIINPSILNVPRILIPKDKLPDDFDINDLEISFNYRCLKMPNPPGCTTGIPAVLTDIVKTR